MQETKYLSFWVVKVGTALVTTKFGQVTYN